MDKNHLMVCVDGVDGAGKTTLCTFLEEKLGIVRYSPTMPMDGDRAPREMKQWGDMIVCDLYAKLGFPIIMDRSYLSVCVYEYLRLQKAMFEKWVKDVSKYNSVIHVVLYGEPEDLTEFQSRKQDHYISIEQLNSQNSLFIYEADRFEKAGLKVLRFRSDSSLIKEEVLSAIQSNISPEDVCQSTFRGRVCRG